MQKKIVVIGGGPGGYVAAIRAAQLGADVTLIEKHKIGGTCLNYGCIPTKTLYKNAELLNTLNHIEDYGITVGPVTIDVPKLQARKDDVVNQLVTGIEQLIKANGIKVLWGHASFASKNELKVTLADGEALMLAFDEAIIASGSKPATPPIGGLDTPGVVTSKELLEFKSIPKRLLVIGGGVIAMEFAGIFNAMGTQVDVVLRSDRLLREVDSEVAKRFTMTLKKRGIVVHKNIAMSHIEKTENGLALFGKSKEEDLVYEADAILISTGRSPVTEGLNLEAVGIAYSHKGITVDQTFKTNIDNIYAIGDVNGHMMLAHAASHQGIAAAEAIMGIDHAGNHEVVPNCIFVFPEIACVGLDEETAKERGIEILKSKFLFAANGKALSIGEPEGFIKVISDTNHKILGVHIMGPHASDLIHEGALAITQSLTVDAIANTIHAHPTLGEAFAEAVLGLKNEAIHMAPVKKKKESKV